MFSRRSRTPEGLDCDFAAAVDDSIAAERAQRWQFTDPYPKIEPALLSAVEVRNYARVAALVHPYEDAKLKAASYPAGMGGTFFRWENGSKIEIKVSSQSKIVLPPNSISFVQTDVIFRLPHYIAMRFNLQISHVHRGILLGTGPVVDPGFEGRLLIPLHNLTSTDYVIPVDEALIWVEFTKTTFRRNEKCPGLDTAGWERFLFPEDKKFMSPDRYFRRANRLDPIESSIPDAIRRLADDAGRAAGDAENARTEAESAKTAAQESKSELDKADKRLLRLGLAGLAAVVIGVVAIYLQAISVVGDAASSIRSAEKIVSDSKAAAEANQDLRKRLLMLEQRLNSLTPESNKAASPPTPLPS